SRPDPPTGRGFYKPGTPFVARRPRMAADPAPSEALGLARCLQIPVEGSGTMSDSALGRDSRPPEQFGEPPIRRHFGRLVGESPAMRRVYLEIARVAPTDAAVLVIGESGTGKDLLAQLIHESSKRAGGPYLPINCGAMSPSLIESELFGHERGSFTGALLRHQGHFERTSGGTLFLDEVTEIPVELQARLLPRIPTGP